MVLVPQAPSLEVQTIIQTAIERGTISRRDHLHLTSALLTNSLLSGDRTQLNYLLETIRRGQVRLVD